MGPWKSQTWLSDYTIITATTTELFIRSCLRTIQQRDKELEIFGVKLSNSVTFDKFESYLKTLAYFSHSNFLERCQGTHPLQPSHCVCAAGAKKKKKKSMCPIIYLLLKLSKVHLCRLPLKTPKYKICNWETQYQSSQCQKKWINVSTLIRKKKTISKI